MKPTERRSAEDLITERFIEALRGGTIPCRKPWTTALPQNLFNRRPYRGINVWMLLLQERPSPFWATFQQVKEHDGHVRKGEHGTPVVFWKTFTRETEEESKNPDVRMFARTFWVFNTDQIEGIEIPEAPPVEPIQSAEAVVLGMTNAPLIHHGGHVASYNRAVDRIDLPAPAAFVRADHYYSTLFHELVHSTGHESRLNRKSLLESAAFGDETYSREELIAEMGAAFLCNASGTETPDTFQNSAAYLRGWLKALLSDERMLIHAAQAAQKATDYILGQDIAPE